MLGQSYSDIEAQLKGARRAAVLEGGSLDEYLGELVKSEGLSRSKKTGLAIELVLSGRFSQRQASDLTGVARDTIRAKLKELPEALEDVMNHEA